MEIDDKHDQGYIAVWLTQAEQLTIDRKMLTKQLLADAGNPGKCRVVFFLSGSDNLYDQIERLLTANLKY